MHLCWRTKEHGVYGAWERLKYEDGTTYEVLLTDISPATSALPKLHAFSHENEAVVSPNEPIWFQVVNTISNSSAITMTSNLTVYINGDEQTGTFAYIIHIGATINCQKPGEIIGKCFIENLQIQNDSIVEIVFLPNAIFYTAGATTYSLFGNPASQSCYYVHSLFIYSSVSLPS